jgi:threonine 3-dehydrogenase
MSTMWALTFDRSKGSWDDTKGLIKQRVEMPVLDESVDAADRSQVLIKVKFAGFCGSDRSIWWRKAFGDMICDSLSEEMKDRRIVGHELLGEIVQVGSRVTEKYGYKPGDIVSTESHIVCGACYQCRLGEHHVCQADKIIGISQDGCFAEYLKLPAKALWPTDISKIRPEVAAVQEPFGNAVHACQTTDLRGKRVAIFGTGTIGLFAILVAKGMGASLIIGVDPSPERRAMAMKLGCDLVLDPARPPEDQPWLADQALLTQVIDATGGIGVDVSMEMAGFNDSLNNAIKVTRRGGTVVMFGVRNGNTVVQDAHKVIMNGLTIHAVVGRQIFATWQITKALLEQQENGIQRGVWETILNSGDGTIIPIEDFEPDHFEKAIGAHPKVVIRFAG